MTHRLSGRFMSPLVLAAFLGLFAAPVLAQVDGYYRNPDIHGDRIVFTAEGDLWTVASSGGLATRLTAHAGEESNPVFSPDGSRVAFRASYDGSNDVYVIPVSGGAPRRITWDARATTLPVGWGADGRVLVRGAWTAGLPDSRLAWVNPASGAVEEIPLAQAAEADVTAGGGLVFARMPRQGSNSRWYKGGTAQKLWRFDGAGKEAVGLTLDYPGTSRQPNAIADGRIYFLSDRQDAMNVWSMRPDGSDLVRHTDFADFDIQELASDGARLVFRMGADLWTLAPGQTARKIDVRLTSDLGQTLTEWEKTPSASDATISHTGKTVALIARGELFTAPVGTGRWVHASRDSGVRYRNVVFTTDSLHVYALSDRSGELEWWKVRVDGTQPPIQVTNGPAMLRQGATPSPDGRYLTHTNRDGRLWLVDLKEGGKTTLLAEAPASSAVAWTPDSKTVVYGRTGDNMFDVLWAHDLASGRAVQITSNRFNDYGPRISPDGNWLYFVSTRTWNSGVGSPWGERAPMPYFDDTAKIYALPLREEAVFPFAEPSELGGAVTAPAPADSAGSAGASASTKASNAAASAGKPVRWDLTDRVREVPVPAGSMAIVGVTGKRILYTEGSNLMALDLKHGAEPVKVIEEAGGYELSGDGEKVLLRKGSKWHVIAASAGAGAKLEGDNEVHLDDWAFAVDKRAEWNQIYMDMWRLHRDYFWDPGMGGIDWVAMREKYAPLLPRVGAREELADLQAMLVSELSLLHSNAGGGDRRIGENTASPAALGGDFERDDRTGSFRLVHRFVHDPDLPEFRSPLAHPDARVEEGSIILAVNGRSTRDARALGEFLLEQAGKQVRLRVQDPDLKERDAVVTAISGGAEFNLRYHEWEHSRRLQADALSNGQIGYVHLRAMGSGDAGQFAREFYSQLDRQGIIIDVRHNGGGNIDSWVLTQLMRRPWAWFKGRTGPVAPNMQFSFGGHLVILVNERSASDGEAVADGFRRLGLGASIGVRTWGGEVWLSGSNVQVDGGVTRASETGVFADDEWLIEGWGFVPDQEVDNLPHATFGGNDAQLEAAVEHLKGLIASDPRPWPEPPAYPRLIPGSGFPTPWRRE